MSRTDNEIRGKIEDKLEEVCKRYGWNSNYIEEYTMAAAIKASAFFQALGYDYGDRIPSVYKLNDTILEIFTFLPDLDSRDKSIGWTGTGMFRLSTEWDEYGEQWMFNISLELADIYEHRIKDDSNE